jgi:Cof subfamily protein (haloacid dehalogenase superfamily)
MERNGVFAGCLLVTDMDGTLLSSEKTIGAANIEALQYFVKEGGLFTLATGRITQSAGRFVEQLPINVPAILYNGAVIYDYAQQTVIWERTLAPTVAKLVDRIMKQYPELGVEVYAGGTPYFVQENEITRHHREIERFYGQSVDGYAAVPTPWYKVLLAGKPDFMDAVQEETASWHITDALWIRSDQRYLEILPLEATKGHALEQLMSVCGIERQRCIAMGDHMNDLEMLRRAGIGVAVENAHPELKRDADRISKHHNEDAVAEVVTWLEQQLRAGNIA